MIYISLDTDVWLQLLAQPLEPGNKFDELLFWIRNGHVRVLLSENILNEWNRNKANKVKEVKGEFSKYYRVNDGIFGNNSAFKSYIQPDEFEKEAQYRIDQLDDIFHNHSIKIPITDDILIAASKRNLNCEAPNHGKDSFRDTVNLLCLLNHLKNNQEVKRCYFTTLNYRDFSVSKNEKAKLHEQLEADFEKAGLEYVYDYERLRGIYLILELPKYLDYLKKKEEKELELEERENKSEALNIKDPPPSYLSNVNLIDIILLEDRPSSAQVQFVISLMNEDEAYYRYVFKNVSTPFWFDVFKRSGFFNSSSVPGPKKHDDGGYSFPNWPPLQLLERLSKRIGEDLNED